MDDAVLQYLAERHCSLQWHDFIGGLSEELFEQLGEAGVRALMTKSGARFAARFAPAQCTTLEEAEREMAQVWLDIDWGWTTIRDTGDALLVRHHCAPVVRGENDDNGQWLADFLKGAYQQWFMALGSSDALKVSAITPFDPAGSIEFRLAR
ncbi:cellulose synthase (plasmid) [Cupriavidus pinatubonensis]|nr:cellulose synthase [Cupriavidus pinatubonensis]